MYAIRSYYGRAAREAHAGRGDPEPGAAETVVRLETCRRLLAAVESLDEPYRTTVRMRWFDGLAPRQIAAAEGVAPHVIWTRLSRAHARLRETLRDVV